MRLVLSLSLVLIGILVIPSSDKLQLKGTKASNEVKKILDEVTEKVTPQPVFVPKTVSHEPSSPSPSPSPSLSPSPHPKLKSVSLTHLTTPPTKLILLDQRRELKDERWEISFPKLDPNQNWHLELEFELNSVENGLGFDNPGFKIWIDEKMVYQRSALEQGPRIIGFSLASFTSPHTLSIWSGNTGDKLKNTWTVINKIQLTSQSSSNIIETEKIDDLVVTVDSSRYSTLEWTSPSTNDVQLMKPFAYELRYSSDVITSQNWSQAQLGEIIWPHCFSPLASGSQTVVLIKTPPLKRGHLAIRSIDSIGTMSTLGESVPFRVED